MQKMPPLSPEQFVDQITFALPRLTRRESKQLLEQSKAWATVYYVGEIPASLEHQLKNLEAQCQFLTM